MLKRPRVSIFHAFKQVAGCNSSFCTDRRNCSIRHTCKKGQSEVPLCFSDKRMKGEDGEGALLRWGGIVGVKVGKEGKGGGEDLCFPVGGRGVEKTLLHMQWQAVTTSNRTGV